MGHPPGVLPWHSIPLRPQTRHPVSWIGGPTGEVWIEAFLQQNGESSAKRQPIDTEGDKQQQGGSGPRSSLRCPEPKKGVSSGSTF